MKPITISPPEVLFNDVPREQPLKDVFMTHPIQIKNNLTAPLVISFKSSNKDRVCASVDQKRIDAGETTQIQVELRLNRSTLATMKADLIKETIFVKSDFFDQKIFVKIMFRNSKSPRIQRSSVDGPRVPLQQLSQERLNQQKGSADPILAQKFLEPQKHNFKPNTSENKINFLSESDEEEEAPKTQTLVQHSHHNFNAAPLQNMGSQAQVNYQQVVQQLQQELAKERENNKNANDRLVAQFKQELTKADPSLTQLMDLTLVKEREKQEQKDKRVLEVLQTKDTQIQTKDVQIKELSAKICEQEEQIGIHQKAVQQLSDQCRAQQQEIQDKIDSLQQMQSKIQGLELSDREKLQQENLNMRDYILNLESQMNSMKHQLQSHEELEFNFQELKINTNEIQESNEALNSEISILRKEKELLSKGNQASQSVKSELQIELESVQNIIKKIYKQTITPKKGQIDLSDYDFMSDKILEKVDSLKTIKETMQKELKQLSQENNDLECQNVENQKAIQSFLKETQEKQKAIKELKEQVKPKVASKQKNVQTEMDINDLEENLVERERLRNENFKLKGEIQAQAEIVRQAKKEIEKQKDEKAINQSKFDSSMLGASMNVSQLGGDDKQALISKLNSKISQMKINEQNLKDQLEQFKGQGFHQKGSSVFTQSQLNGCDTQILNHTQTQNLSQIDTGRPAGSSAEHEIKLLEQRDIIHNLEKQVHDLKNSQKKSSYEFSLKENSYESQIKTLEQKLQVLDRQSNLTSDTHYTKKLEIQQIQLRESLQKQDKQVLTMQQYIEHLQTQMACQNEMQIQNTTNHQSQLDNSNSQALLVKITQQSKEITHLKSLLRAAKLELDNLILQQTDPYSYIRQYYDSRISNLKEILNGAVRDKIQSISLLDKQTKEYTSKLKQLEKNYSICYTQMEQDLLDQSSYIERLETKLDHYESKHVEQFSQIENLYSKISEMEIRLKQSDKNMQEMAMKKDDIINDYVNRLQVLKNELQEKQAFAATLMDNIENKMTEEQNPLVEKYYELLAQYCQIQSANGSLDRTRLEYKNQISSQQKRLLLYQQSLHESETESEHLRQAIVEYKMQEKHSNKEIERQRNELELLQKQLVDKQSDAIKLQAMLQQNQLDMQQSVFKIDQHESQIPNIVEEDPKIQLMKTLQDDVRKLNLSLYEYMTDLTTKSSPDNEQLQDIFSFLDQRVRSISNEVDQIQFSPCPSPSPQLVKQIKNLTSDLFETKQKLHNTQSSLSTYMHQSQIHYTELLKQKDTQITSLSQSFGSLQNELSSLQVIQNQSALSRKQEQQQIQNLKLENEQKDVKLQQMQSVSLAQSVQEFRTEVEKRVESIGTMVVKMVNSNALDISEDMVGKLKQNAQLQVMLQSKIVEVEQLQKNIFILEQDKSHKQQIYNSLNDPSSTSSTILQNTPSSKLTEMNSNQKDHQLSQLKQQLSEMKIKVLTLQTKNTSLQQSAQNFEESMRSNNTHTNVQDNSHIMQIQEVNKIKEQYEQEKIALVREKEMQFAEYKRELEREFQSKAMKYKEGEAPGELKQRIKELEKEIKSQQKDLNEKENNLKDMILFKSRLTEQLSQSEQRYQQLDGKLSEFTSSFLKQATAPTGKKDKASQKLEKYQITPAKIFLTLLQSKINEGEAVIECRLARERVSQLEQQVRQQYIEGLSKAFDQSTIKDQNQSQKLTESQLEVPSSSQTQNYCQCKRELYLPQSMMKLQDLIRLTQKEDNSDNYIETLIYLCHEIASRENSHKDLSQSISHSQFNKAATAIQSYQGSELPVEQCQRQIIKALYETLQTHTKQGQNPISIKPPNMEEDRKIWYLELIENQIEYSTQLLDQLNSYTQQVQIQVKGAIGPQANFRASAIDLAKQTKLAADAVEQLRYICSLIRPDLEGIAQGCSSVMQTQRPNDSQHNMNTVNPFNSEQYPAKTLQAMQFQSETELLGLKDKVSLLEKIRSELEDQVVSLKVEVEHSKQEKHTSSSIMSELKQKLSDIKRLTEENEFLNLQLTNAQSDLEICSKKASNLQQELDKKDEKVKNLSIAMDKQKVDAHKEKKKIEKEFNLSKEELGQVQAELKKIKKREGVAVKGKEEEMSVLREENENYRQKISEMNLKMEKEFEDRKAELEFWIKERQEMKTQINQLNAQVLAAPPAQSNVICGNLKTSQNSILNMSHRTEYASDNETMKLKRQKNRKDKERVADKKRKKEGLSKRRQIKELTEQIDIALREREDKERMNKILQQENQLVKQKFNDLIKENEFFRAKCMTTTSATSKLKQTDDEIKKELNELRQAFTVVNLERERMLQNVCKEREVSHSFKQNALDLVDLIKEMEQKIQRLEQEKERTEKLRVQDVSHVRNEISLLAQKVEQADQVIQNGEDERENLTKRNQQLMLELEHLQKVRTTTNEERSEQDEHIFQLQDQIRAMEDDMRSMEDEFREQLAEFEEGMQNLITGRKEMVQLYETHMEKFKYKIGLQLEKAQKGIPVEKLMDGIHELTQKDAVIQNLQKKVKQSQSKPKKSIQSSHMYGEEGPQILKLKQQNESLQLRVHQLTQSLKIKEEEAGLTSEPIVQEIQKLTVQIKKKDQQLKNMKEENSKLTLDVQSNLETLTHKESAQTMQAEKKIRQLTMDLERKQSVIDELKDQKKAITSRYDQISQILKEQEDGRNETLRVKKELTRKDQIAKDYKSQAQDLKDQIQQLTQDMTKAHNEAKQYKMELQRKEKLLQDYKSKMETLVQEKQQMAASQQTQNQENQHKNHQDKMTSSQSSKIKALESRLEMNQSQLNKTQKDHHEVVVDLEKEISKLKKINSMKDKTFRELNKEMQTVLMGVSTQMIHIIMEHTQSQQSSGNNNLSSKHLQESMKILDLSQDDLFDFVSQERQEVKRLKELQEVLKDGDYHKQSLYIKQQLEDCLVYIKKILRESKESESKATPVVSQSTDPFSNPNKTSLHSIQMQIQDNNMSLRDLENVLNK